MEKRIPCAFQENNCRRKGLEIFHEMAESMIKISHLQRILVFNKYGCQSNV